MHSFLAPSYPKFAHSIPRRPLKRFQAPAHCSACGARCVTYQTHRGDRTINDYSGRDSGNEKKKLKSKIRAYAPVRPADQVFCREASARSSYVVAAMPIARVILARQVIEERDAVSKDCDTSTAGDRASDSKACARGAVSLSPLGQDHFSISSSAISDSGRT
jgi:hypothetical protein